MAYKKGLREERYAARYASTADAEKLLQSTFRKLYKLNKYDKFYACSSCKCWTDVNKHTAAAAVFCCEEYEDAAKQPRAATSCHGG